MKKALISLAVSILTRLVLNKVKDTRLLAFLTLIVEALGKFADVLTDSDKDNQAQALQVWQQMKPDIADLFLLIVMDEIEFRVKDPVVQALLVNAAQTFADYFLAYRSKSSLRSLAARGVVPPTKATKA